MSQPIAAWRVSYTPGNWVALAGPTSLVILQPAPARISGLLNQFWETILNTTSIHELSSQLVAHDLAQLQSFGLLFWDNDGLHAITRGTVRILDAKAGNLLATGEGVTTWTETILGADKDIFIELEPIEYETAMHLPLVVGGAQVSSVYLTTEPTALAYSEQTDLLNQSPNSSESAEAESLSAAEFPPIVGSPMVAAPLIEPLVPQFNSDLISQPHHGEDEYKEANLADAAELIDADANFNQSVAIEEVASNQVEKPFEDPSVQPVPVTGLEAIEEEVNQSNDFDSFASFFDQTDSGEVLLDDSLETSAINVAPDVVGVTALPNSVVEAQGPDVAEIPISDPETPADAVIKDQYAQDSIATSLESAAQDELISAVICQRGHPNMPGAQYCRICNDPVGTIPRLLPRPTLAFVRANFGVSLDLGKPVLVGRAPDTRGDSSVQVMKVPSANTDISRTHLRIQAQQWRIEITDLHSTNGSVLTVPGYPPFKLEPGTATTVPLGAVVDLGDGVQIKLDPPV